MTKEYITGIWLAKFENAAELSKYVEYDYSENEDNPNCKFADEIGLSHIDTDFLESNFVGSSSEILGSITNISFVENFQNELLTDVSLIDYTDKNSIISISGIRGKGTVNVDMFNWTPTLGKKEYLQFVGLYEFKVSN